MSKNSQNTVPKELIKIIYFDEGSVTDYIQIMEGGNLIKTTELLSDDSNNGAAKVDTEASVGISGLFKSLVGVGVKAQTEATIETSFRSESLVKTILQNTILTDFLDIVGKQKSKTFVKVFENINIKAIKDSLSYIIMISPYMKMLKGNGLNINTDLDLSIDVVNMDESIKLAKGYFEFEGIIDNGSVILRFNIDSFKNNYKISDLLKMNLTIYAVAVGKTNRKNISIVSEINASISDVSKDLYDNPQYGEDNKENDNGNDDLIVYDVLLAGVAQNE